MPGEIATAYVRLRPISDNFRSEAQSQIKSSLAQLNRTAAADSQRALRSQVDLAKKSNVELATLARQQARANVESGAEQIRELKAIAEQYKVLGRDATLSSEQQRVAARLAAEAQAKAMIGISKHAKEAERSEHSLSESVKGLAATFGTTIGAVAGINFLKEVVNSAAQGQKALEAIRAQFGASGEAIKKWAEGAAADLGLSAAAAESTAARFGIAYHQIGIGQHLAATMTLNFEKLAASIAAIRGIKPDQVFQSLTGAATGNTRALRVLGISIDQSQLKWAALKLGIISTVKNALTPAQRAEAVYALATAKLSDYQIQARKHAKDLANQQLKLSAEWSNAKDIIGTALIPVLVKLITHLATWLGKMEKSGKLQRDVNEAVKKGTAIISALKAVLVPMIGILQKLTRGLGGTKHAVELLTTAFLGLKAVKLLQGLGLVATKEKMIGVEAETARGRVAKLRAGLLGIAGKVFTVVLVTDIVSSFLPQPKNPNAGTKLFQGIPVLGQAAGFGQWLAEQIQGQPKLPKWAQQTLAGKKIGTKKVLTAQDVANSPGTTPAWVRAHRQNFVTENDYKLALAIAEAIFQTKTAKRQNVVAKAIKADAQKQIDALKHQFSVGQAAADSIFNKQIAARVKTAQMQLAAAIRAGGALIANAQASLRAYILRGNAANVQALKQEQATLEGAGKRAIRNMQTLGSTLIADIAKFQSAAQQKVKKKPLTGAGPFGPDVALLTRLMAGGTPSPELEQAINNVKSTLSGRGLFHTKKKAATETAAQKLAEAKRVVSAHINLLVEQAQKGQITVKQLSERLNKYLEKSGFTYHKIAKLLGTAAADKIKADVKNLSDQLHQIDLLPPKLKKKLLAQSQGGLTNPVVSIAAALARIHNEDKVRGARYDAGLKAELRRLRLAQQHDREIIAKAQQHLHDVNAANQLLVARHSHQELVKHTKLLGTIAKVSAKAAAAQQAIAQVHLGATASGFPTSTKQNPGATSHHARTAAASGVTGAGG